MPDNQHRGMQAESPEGIALRSVFFIPRDGMADVLHVNADLVLSPGFQRDIKQRFSEFIRQTLKMELSEEKTLITHSNQCARFLGYDIRVRRNNTVKPHGSHLQRTLNNKVELCVPLAR